MSLEKDPQQEDFLQGRMLGNPYSSNEPGLGPLMRDVKNKICQGRFSLLPVHGLIPNQTVNTCNNTEQTSMLMPITILVKWRGPHQYFKSSQIKV